MSKNGSTPRQKTLMPKASSPGKSSLALWVVGGAMMVGAFFYLFHPIMVPFIVALIFAYALDPAVTFFERKGLGRTAATSLMVLSVLIFIVTLLFFTIPFLKSELTSLAVTLPPYLTSLLEGIMPKIQEWISGFQGDFQTEIQNTLTENFSKMLGWSVTFIAGLFTNTLALANLVSLVVLTPLLIFYLLRDWPKILIYLQGLVPPHLRKSSTQLASDINTTLSGYFRGQASVCLILAVYYVLTLSMIGMNYAFTVGLLGGLLAFIPYLGFFIGFIAALSISLAQFATLDPVFIVAGIYIIGTTLEGFLLVPKLVGDRVGLHPVWVIFALLGGALLMGFTGLLLAVPVSAVLAVLIRFAMTRYQKRLKGSKK